MTGAEYIAEFLSQRNIAHAYLVTGGACAFIVDAIGSHPKLKYICCQHEQSAAMAADAVWRVDPMQVGVTVATSGPGATNLLTGIGCSYFDSIPSIHITGQVNKAESANYMGADVRQAGFQETDIVEIVKPITKYAVQIDSIESLKRELIKAYNIAITGRMGPVLIDVPMNIQKQNIEGPIEYHAPEAIGFSKEMDIIPKLKEDLRKLLSTSERPLVLFGAGVGLAGAANEVIQWLETQKVPFVSSWNAASFFNHDSPDYYGNIGVYGNRGGNYIIQNCDTLLVMGSRLDNRQRSGNALSFAPEANVFVIDVDGEELKKYEQDGYKSAQLNLCNIPKVLEGLTTPSISSAWRNYLDEMKQRYFGKDISTFAEEQGALSPYQVVQRLNTLMDPDAIVAMETGANLCWMYQIFHRTDQIIFAPGGMSPMGYALPAAIGSALTAPEKQIFCIAGDGGFQMNIQELQTLKYHDLDIKIVIFNNGGYGMIKQFQDSYFDSRYEATGKGYSVPEFEGIVKAYGLQYKRINHVEDITKDLLVSGAIVLEIMLHPNTLIEPKLEMGRPIHDQFPYVSDQEFKEANRFVHYDRKN